MSDGKGQMDANAHVVLRHPETRAHMVVDAPVTRVVVGEDGVEVRGISGRPIVTAPLSSVVSVTVRGGASE